MNIIENFVEPKRLWLFWQPPEGHGERRRRVVAEIVDDQGDIVFRYMDQSDDYRAARQEGFDGYPAFNRAVQEHRSGVMEALLRRLPPRKRKDFGAYLEKYRLPPEFSGSDLALLGYTGGRLPGDGFELSPDLSTTFPPLEIVVEVAGFRHQGVAVESLNAGDVVYLEAEPENPHDQEAIAVRHGVGRIGYIPAPLAKTVHRWINEFQVSCVIERLNGTPGRPLVYLFLSVR